jgi:deoxyadenosine/deoxycytidine kinase
MDGSLATDKNVYAQMLHDDGHMDAIEWSSYNIWEQFHQKYVKQNKIIYVYLRCDPQVILDRIRKRGRPEEKDVDLTYLIKLQGYLDRWVQEEQKLHPDRQIFIVDFTYPEDSQEYQNMLQHIMGALGTPKLKYISASQ